MTKRSAVGGSASQASRSSPSPRSPCSRPARSAAAHARRRAATSTLNENAWAGSTSNVYVVKYVLEKKLGCKVKVTNITEDQPSFQAMADGKIDVVLEDWDNLVAGTRST